MDVSVIIINHNTKDLTAQTVESVLAATHKASFEVLVMDNSSNEAQRYLGMKDERIPSCTMAPSTQALPI